MNTSAMDDDTILQRIGELVGEERALRRSGETVDQDRERRIEETLDQCWDLLRQRRARRQYDGDPDAVSVRPVKTVEHYQQ